jgi:hypothetical protein
MDYSTGVGQPSRPTRVMLYLAIFFFLLMLLPLGVAAYRERAFQSGVPATATVENCVRNKGWETCKGYWRIDQVSERGEILGGEMFSRGEQVSVRVYDGMAYSRSLDFGPFGVAAPRPASEASCCSGTSRTRGAGEGCAGGNVVPFALASTVVA